jgi:hypothetical protein
MLSGLLNATNIQEIVFYVIFNDFCVVDVCIK